MKRRLPLWLTAIFAAFHLIVIGGAMLESPQGGEGFAFVIAAYDWPLLALCKNTALCGHKYHGPGVANLVILLAGTLIYALAGFVIGTVIGWLRVLIAPRLADLLREVRKARLHTRMAIMLPVIFAGIHFLVVGAGLLEGAQNGGGAVGLLIWDLPLLALWAHSGLGRSLGPFSFTPLGSLIYLLAGTLTYALIGFVVGAVIDGVRALIASRQGTD